VKLGSKIALQNGNTSMYTDSRKFIIEAYDITVYFLNQRRSIKDKRVRTEDLENVLKS
jgi:hypothetical protein